MSEPKSLSGGHRYFRSPCHNQTLTRSNQIFCQLTVHPFNFPGRQKSISSESSRKKHLISLDVTRISGNGLKLVEETFLLFLFPRFLKVFRFDLDPFFIKNILPETSSLISRCNNLFARCYSGKL